MVLVDDAARTEQTRSPRPSPRATRACGLTTSAHDHGPSFKRAVAAARKEFLFWQTVDWAYDLTHLRIFLELLKHYDVVVGIRPVPIRLLAFIPVIGSIYRVRGRSDNFRKAIVSLGNYYLLRGLYGMHFQDSKHPFYPTKSPIVTPMGKAFMAPSSWRGHGPWMPVTRSADSFVPRRGGEAKGTKFGSIVHPSGTLAKMVRWGGAAGSAARRAADVGECRALRFEERGPRIVVTVFKRFRRASPEEDASPCG